MKIIKNLRLRGKVVLGLAVLVLVVATGSAAFAKTATRNYSGTYKGKRCSVMVNWHNWTGLGAVDGHINLPNDTTIPFSGNNSRTGVLEVEAAGESIVLKKVRTGSVVTWAGKFLTFSNKAPKAVVSSPAMVVKRKAPPLGKKTYVGAWRAKACEATIEWVAGDDEDTLRRGKGMLIVEGDMALSIEGWQPRENYIEFTTTDPKKVTIIEDSSLEKDPEIDHFKHLCPGLGGYQVIHEGGDLRSWINLKLKGQTTDLMAATLAACPGQFPAKANNVVQWRGFRTAKGFAPYAIIFRMMSSADDAEQTRLETLIIIKLAGEKSRVVAHVPAKDGNQKAEQVADKLCSR